MVERNQKYIKSHLSVNHACLWERRFSGIGEMTETAEMVEIQEFLSGRASIALAL